LDIQPVERNLVKDILADYNGFMGIEQQTATWVLVILTAMRKRLGLSRSEFLPIVQKYRLIHFLLEQYELLHYYDNDYITGNAMHFIEEQGGKLYELPRTV
jgi:hypothetical protein